MVLNNFLPYKFSSYKLKRSQSSEAVIVKASEGNNSKWGLKSGTFNLQLSRYWRTKMNSATTETICKW